jgi:hypothetical protein
MRELALKTITSNFTKKITIYKTKIKKLTHSNHQNTQFPSNFTMVPRAILNPRTPKVFF